MAVFHKRSSSRFFAAARLSDLLVPGTVVDGDAPVTAPDLDDDENDDLCVLCERLRRSDSSLKARKRACAC